MYRGLRLRRRHSCRSAAQGFPATVEAETFHDGYARVMSPLAAVSTLAGVAALARPRLRRVAGAVAVAITAAIADDISNGVRLFRRTAVPSKTTGNVVGLCGAPSD